MLGNKSRLVLKGEGGADMFGLPIWAEINDSAISMAPDELLLLS